jgi:hypothetical protein
LLTQRDTRHYPSKAPRDSKAKEIEASEIEASALTLGRFVPDFVLEHVYEVGLLVFVKLF